MNSLDATNIARDMYYRYLHSGALIIRRDHTSDTWKDYLSSVTPKQFIAELLDLVQPFNYIGCIGEDVVEFEISFLKYPIYIKLERDKSIISFHYSTRQNIILNTKEKYEIMLSTDNKYKIGLPSLYVELHNEKYYKETNRGVTQVSGGYIVSILSALNTRYNRKIEDILQDIDYYFMNELKTTTLYTFIETIKCIPNKDKLLTGYLIDKMNDGSYINNAYELQLLSDLTDRNKYIKEYLMQLKGFIPDNEIRLLENKTHEF